MTTKTKPVRLCVEGATTDGRKVQRQWLTDIAKNYNPSVYGARINMEHWNTSWMPRFGDVESVYSEEIQDGPLAGKLALYGILSPTPELVAMNKRRQKVYTSIEIDPDFSDSGSAYLVGLAVTDNPASLGTSMLQFSADNGRHALAERKQSAHNIFTTAEETNIELMEETLPPDSARPSLLSRVKNLFNREQQQQHAQFEDVYKAVEYCAARQMETDKQVASLSQQLATLETLTQATGELKGEVDALKTLLASQDNQPQRPVTLGTGTSMADKLTDC